MKKDISIYKLKQNLLEYGRKQSEIEWEQKTPVQKIGIHIRKINKEFKIVERYLNEANRIKIETGTSSRAFWKRTQKSFVKLETRMRILMRKLRNLRG